MDRQPPSLDLLFQTLADLARRPSREKRLDRLGDFLKNNPEDQA